MSFYNQVGLKDAQTGEAAWVTEFHVSRASPIVRLVGTPFIGSTKDTNFWTETDANGGTVTQGAGQIVLATNTTANGTTQYQTVRMARWVTGAENTFRTVMKVGDTGTVNNTRNWGAFSATDGVFFQLTGTTLNIVTRAASSDTAVPKASWNVNTSFTLDTNFHVYEISYSYASINFYIDDVLVHQYNHAVNPFSVLKSQTLTLPVTLQNNNSGSSTTNVTMTVGVAFISRTGLLSTEAQYFHGTTAATTTLKFGAGRLHRITIGDSGGTSITIFDNTTNAAPIISIIANPAANNPYVLEYDIPFNTGLTVTSVGTWDFTVVYE